MDLKRCDRSSVQRGVQEINDLTVTVCVIAFELHLRPELTSLCGPAGTTGIMGDGISAGKGALQLPSVFGDEA